MAEKELIQKLREHWSPKVTVELLTSHADKLRQLDEKLTKTIETYNETILKIHERLTKLERQK